MQKLENVCMQILKLAQGNIRATTQELVNKVIGGMSHEHNVHKLSSEIVHKREVKILRG